MLKSPPASAHSPPPPPTYQPHSLNLFLFCWSQRRIQCGPYSPSAPEVPKGHKRKPFSRSLFYIYIFYTFTSLFAELAPDMQVVLPITMSLKSLVISFPRPLHYSFPALPLWPFHSLSHCSSHPALLHSQRLKIKEIKHRYWVLACELT